MKIWGDNLPKRRKKPISNCSYVKLSSFHAFYYQISIIILKNTSEFRILIIIIIHVDSINPITEEHDSSHGWQYYLH